LSGVGFGGFVFEEVGSAGAVGFCIGLHFFYEGFDFFPEVGWDF
jgi:hypothetical protein